MTGSDEPTEAYTRREELPSPEAFLALRDANDMAERPPDAVEAGLAHSSFGVTVVHDASGDVVGMGRMIADDAMVYQISDVAVHPEHQRRGLGTWMLESLLEYVAETAPARAEVNLFADVDGFYERFDFGETRPVSKGMVRFVDPRSPDWETGN